MITLRDYLTASGKYPEREQHKELTEQMIADAEQLLRRVNKLLIDLGISNVKVSSGFRPSEVNNGISNAAKKSLHMTCCAIDIQDGDGSLAALIKKKEEEGGDFLKSYGLWLESPEATKGWCHLDQSVSRTDRKIRIFKP